MLIGSRELKLEELSLCECEPELEVECAPLWVVEDVHKSLGALLLALQEVLSELVVFLRAGLAQTLHEESIGSVGWHWIHAQLEHGFDCLLFLRAELIWVTGFN